VAQSSTCTSTEQPLDVAQELQAQPLALAGARDETGDVGDGERRPAGLDDPEVGHEGRERVVGDLRAGRAEGRDQAGLAGAGEADEGGVGHALELQDDVAGLARLAEQREAGGLALGAGQAGVAEAAAAAAGDDEPGALARRGRRAGCPSASSTTVPLGTGSSTVSPLAPLRIEPWPGAAAGGALVRAVVVVEQRGGVVVDDQDDVAAVPAVGAVRAAQGLELLAVDRAAAVPAVAGGDVQHDAVDERGHEVLLPCPA
jgi:hypothetical protein